MNLVIKVTPGARRDESLGWEDHYPGIGRVLRLRIAAPATENRANKAIVAFLARALHLPKSAVSIARGASSSIKLIHLPEHTDLAPLIPSPKQHDAH